MNQEYQLTKLRAILLDETNPNAERVAAQRQIMKILDLKEKETDGEYPGNDNMAKRELPEPIGFNAEDYDKEVTSENGI